MDEFATLTEYLSDWAKGEPRRDAISQVIEAIAEAGGAIAGLIGQGPLAGALGASLGDNRSGDTQKELDLRANDILIERLSQTPVAHIFSEELDAPHPTDAPDAPFCIALDPLDGSSNIDTNVSVGTIFSLMPNRESGDGALAHRFLQPGVNQVAAGYVIYGPQTALVLTVGAGTQIFTLDRESGSYRLTAADVKVPVRTKEFGINASNYRHWDAHVRLYINDCLEGTEGPRGKDFNMRWVASLVAECHRILSRGGVFLYPGDDRKGYGNGRLRLLYEANPMAWLIEQAGGAASTGLMPVMEVEPTELHQRIPLIFGSLDEVTHIERYYSEIGMAGERSPLFGDRGLFRN